MIELFTVRYFGSVLGFGVLIGVVYYLVVVVVVMVGVEFSYTQQVLVLVLLVVVVLFLRPQLLSWGFGRSK